MSVAAIPIDAASLLDRLIDAAPDLSIDPPRSRQNLTRDTLESIRRDLEALLNTRRRPMSPPSALRQLRRSLLSYGTGDFIGANMVTIEQRRTFAAKLEEAIRDSEPRLRHLAVTVLNPRDSSERVLRLRIEAVVSLDDVAMPVLFASTISPSTLRFSVSEASDV
jgi:type VI secretion system protein ImpF